MEGVYTGPAAFRALTEIRAAILAIPRATPAGLPANRQEGDMEEVYTGQAALKALTEIRKRQLLPALEAAILEVAHAVQATGKAGAVALTIKIKPFGKGMDNPLVFSDSLVVRAPVNDPLETLLYITDDDQISTRDQRQPELPLTVMRAASNG